MVRVYITDVRELPDPLYSPEVIDGLSKERKEKILRYKRERNRKQSLGAGLLIQKIFAERGLFLEDIVYNSNGKPEVEGLCFNISHSRDMVVCTISDEPVGCDIEEIREGIEGIAERYFTVDELRYLNKFTLNAKIKEFYRLWTMKESYLKMTGEGIKVELNRIEFRLKDKVQVYREGILCNCLIKEYELPDYKLTVCAQEDNFAKHIEWVYF